MNRIVATFAVILFVFSSVFTVAQEGTANCQNIQQVVNEYGDLEYIDGKTFGEFFQSQNPECYDTSVAVQPEAECTQGYCGDPIAGLWLWKKTASSIDSTRSSPACDSTIEPGKDSFVYVDFTAREIVTAVHLKPRVFDDYLYSERRYSSGSQNSWQLSFVSPTTIKAYISIWRHYDDGACLWESEENVLTLYDAEGCLVGTQGKTNVRTRPTTNSPVSKVWDINGEFQSPVMDWIIDGGYSWYQVGEDQWVRNDVVKEFGRCR